MTCKIIKPYYYFSKAKKKSLKCAYMLWVLVRSTNKVICSRIRNMEFEPCLHKYQFGGFA